MCKKYIEDSPRFVVLPHDFGKNLKIENSYKATIKFLWNSRLSEADKLCEKRIRRYRQDRVNSNPLCMI